MNYFVLGKEEKLQSNDIANTCGYTNKKES